MLEQIRTDMVELGNKLQEKALAGECIGVVQVLLLADGRLLVESMGVRGTEVLGMLDLGKTIIRRKLV